jgi:PAS domain S-box-containing protein
MGHRFWRSAGPGLTGMALVSGLLAGHLWLLGDARSLPHVLVLTFGAGAAAGLVVQALAWALRRSQERLLKQIVERLVALRENPSPHVLHPLAGPGNDELAPVTAQLDLLADCYRRALAEVVRAHETLEELQTAQGRGEPDNSDRGPAPSTHYVVGSSRHRMVARLAPNLHWMAATTPLQQFLSTSINDLVARPFLEFVHPEDADGLRRALQDALKDGEGHNITFRVLIPARAGAGHDADDDTTVQGASAGVGASQLYVSQEDTLLLSSPPKDRGAARSLRERHLQMDVMTCYTEQNVPLHLRCHFLDITDRVLTEQKLRLRTAELSQANARLRQINADLQRLKESYRDLYHQAPVLYFGLDARGHFVAVNDTLLRTLGYPREALLQQHYTKLLPPGSRAAFLADPAMFQRPGELEAQWLKADGTVIDVWIGTTTIRDARGAFVHSRSAARDVTERNRLANTVRAKAEELGRANAELRRINQELKDFTYVVSHDLKEPLRTLEAFSNFLAQDYSPSLGSEGQEYITHLIQASRRLGALIDDLLTLSRAGRVINTPRPFSLEEAFQTVRQDLRDLAQRQKAAVRVEGPLPPVAGDPERVTQLLANLVSNGLKYNSSPHPEVVLGAVPGDAGGRAQDSAPPGFVTLFVRDNGIGIDPAYHEQIFRMFRRLHRRDEVEGTGAGLAICKKVVEAHGGRIWVESQAGRGSTFYFTLPRAAAAPPGPAGEEERPAPAAGRLDRDEPAAARAGPRAALRAAPPAVSLGSGEPLP